MSSHQIQFQHGMLRHVSNQGYDCPMQFLLTNILVLHL
jgi:hypothetical protein